MNLPVSVTDPAARRVRTWLWRNARPARWWIVLSAALAWGGGLLVIAQAGLIARIVAGAVSARLPRRALLPLFAALLAVIAARAALSWAKEAAGFRAGACVRDAVRRRLVEGMLAAGPGITRQHAPGALTSAVMEQVEALHDFYAFYLPQLGAAVLIPLSIAVAVWRHSWAAAVILGVTAPLIPLFMVIIGMGAESISQRHFQALARLSDHFLDLLRGLPTLKLFDRSRDRKALVAAVSHEYRRRTMAVLRVAFLSSAVLEFFSAIAIALVAVYLGTSYLGYLDFGAWGRPLTLSVGLFILILAPEFYLPLRELGTHYHARAAAIGAAEEINRVQAPTAPGATPPTRGARPSAAAPIRFDGVRLTPILNGVSFTLAPGHQAALVGASGAGKTTLLNLLLGFQAPEAGRIWIGDCPLESLDPVSWREQLAWIGQHPVLFHGTLRDNIRLGRPDAAPAEIDCAAQAAAVTAFSARLPQGLDTPIGEMGQGLSRGQAQRVALARAFLKDAPVLLLDEPTAGLDAENERLVLEALRTLRRGRTVLMVSHRLANLDASTRVLLLVDGRIAADGPLPRLRAPGGALNDRPPDPDQEAFAGG